MSVRCTIRWTDPERDQRSEPQLTGLINTTPFITS